MNTKVKSLRMITVTAIMSALSAVLMFVEFSIPIMPSFIKLDISDLPALITSYAFGPVCGVAVCLVKNLIHLLATQTAGVGELSNFIHGVVFVFVAGMFYKYHHNRKFAFIGAMPMVLLISVLPMLIIIFCAQKTTNWIPRPPTARDTISLKDIYRPIGGFFQ